MSFVRTIDLFCDQCGNWKQGLVGWGSGIKKRIWARFKSEGWERRIEAGRVVHICPACLDKVSHEAYFDCSER